MLMLMLMETYMYLQLRNRVLVCTLFNNFFKILATTSDLLLSSFNFKIVMTIRLLGCLEGMGNNPHFKIMAYATSSLSCYSAYACAYA